MILLATLVFPFICYGGFLFWLLAGDAVQRVVGKGGKL